MAFKHYYNGKLVRTSERHEYHFAVLNESGSVYSCHGTLEAAQKAKRSLESNVETALDHYRTAIRAIQKGKTYITVKCGRASVPVKLTGKNGDPATWERYIEADLKRLEILKQYQVVELEIR